MVNFGLDSKVSQSLLVNVCSLESALRSSAMTILQNDRIKSALSEDKFTLR